MNAKYAVVIASVITLSLGASAGLRASELDDRIQAAANNSYAFRTYLKDDDIKVESKDGTVTLTGTVSGLSHRLLAEDTVAALPGVKEVRNDLQIKPPETSGMVDGVISARVKFALLFHRSVSATTQVNVKDGVVTLTGPASSQAEKDLATEYTREVEGVKDVDNQMTVVPASSAQPTLSGQIDDASITAQVKVDLLLNRSTSVLRTDVTTENGVVTLRGTARNQAEIDLVTKLVEDINGVKDVKNEMKVED